MKIHETTFEEYVSFFKNNPQFLKTNPVGFPEKNCIYYGPSGSGKYSQALYSIQSCSPTKLKYEKKMTLQTEKGEYTFRFSDIHYEIDMSLLGCNSKIIWDTFFQQVVEIISVKPDKRGIIVCTNFHCIHTELLDSFSSYYKQFFKRNDQPFNRNDICIRYIILTEHLSFIPSLILNSSSIISIPKRKNISLDLINEFEQFPLVAQQKKTDIVKRSTQKNGQTNPVDLFHKVCFPIFECVRNTRNGSSTLNLFQFRDLLYDINIYQIDTLECLWFVLFSLVETGEIEQETVSKYYAEIAFFLKYYNNNYRSIYHFENIFLGLCT